MKPSDLGLPAKFPVWRRNQERAILAAVCSEKRFRLLCAPPGVGKSAIYMGISSLLGGRSLILTHTKGLQDQLCGDFAAMGLREVRGQANYPCLYLEEEGRRRPGCDEGPCHAGVECELKHSGCHYYDAVRRANHAQYVVTNYAYWMALCRYSEPFVLGNFSTVILDEAHRAPDTLAEFVRVTLVRSEMRDLLQVTMPRNMDIDLWVEWAHEVRPKSKELLENAVNNAKMGSHWVGIVRRLRQVYDGLTNLSLARQWHRTDAPDPPAWMPGTETDWAIDETPSGVTFQPVWAGGYAEMYLFNRIPNVLLTSATLTPRDAGYLGIQDFSYEEYPSPFRKAIRPLYVVPGVNVSRHWSPGEERVWVNRIDQILDLELGQGHKGIIHTVSYERAQKIVARSRHRKLMMSHETRNLRSTVDSFMRSTGPRVLVSPAVGTGFDFRGDTARFQILAKVPFIDSRPTIVQMRKKADKRYLDHVTVVSIIQQVGRGVRSEDDYCRNWIVDDNFSRWFLPRNKKMFPQWFRSAIRRVASVRDVADSK